jgi:hypothetical protein
MLHVFHKCFTLHHAIKRFGPSLGTHKCFTLPKRFIGAETGVLSVYMDEFDDGAKQAHVAGRGRGRFHRFHVSKREQARVSPAISRDLV